MKAFDRTVADLHSVLNSNLGEVGVSGQLGTPAAFRGRSPIEKNARWAPTPGLGHFENWKNPSTTRERNQEPSLIKPVAQPLHDLQFAIISKSALQNTTPYPVILRYQRWKQQGHSKRIFQSEDILRTYKPLERTSAADIRAQQSSAAPWSSYAEISSTQHTCAAYRHFWFTYL